MPDNFEQKAVDQEAELSNAQRIFQNLAPICSVEKRAGGIPQLASQEKQLYILASELKEILLCINLSKNGMHGLRAHSVKSGMKKSILDFEKLNGELRDEGAQGSELDCLNYLTQKQVVDLMKNVPTEADELRMIENANTRLRRMENKLDLAMKRCCLVNTDNKKMREEINILLVERNNFNIQWNRTIGKLVKGKEYLMDILEIASYVFNDRDECCKKLEALKWKGLFQMNRDIMEMQSCESELNHLAKLEEFLRVKGSRRICEADEKEEIRRQEEFQRCQDEIKCHDALLEDIFAFTGLEGISNITKKTNADEIQNFSIFTLLCDVSQESIQIQKELSALRQTIMDQRVRNEKKKDDEEKKLAELSSDLQAKREVTNSMRERNDAAENLFLRILRGIDDLFRQAKCDTTTLKSLLGNHKGVTKWNVKKFLLILEAEVNSLIEIVYGAVKPPAPTPKGRKTSVHSPVKPVADPQVEILIPNKISKLVPYQPCAYCVEDYIMHLVFEKPAMPANEEYIHKIFHLENVNTIFGIYTLTIPEKRHPFKGTRKE